MFLQNSAPQQRGQLAAPGALLLILLTLMVLAGERMSVLESAFYDFLQKQQPVAASERIIIVDHTRIVMLALAVASTAVTLLSWRKK